MLQRQEYQRNRAKGQANHVKYQHLLKLADVDENGAISPIEETLLKERVPFLREREGWNNDINSVTASDLAPGCCFRDYEVEKAIRRYEEDLVEF